MRLALIVILWLVIFPAISATEHRLFESPVWPPKQPLAMSELMPQQSAVVSQVMQGKLVLSMQKTTSRLKPIDAKKQLNDGRELLPNMQIDYVVNQNSEVIPNQRHLILTDNPYWDYFVGVGVMWPVEEGQTTHKITLPFALVEKNENCVHNGVLVIESTILNTEQRFYYQISNETCAYFKADFWGAGTAVNLASKQLDAAEVISLYKKEKDNRIPTLALSALKNHVPALNVSNLALSKKIAAEDMTVYGLLIDDMHYLSTCQTRAGAYPFCQQLVLPSYSTAKSLFAAMSMFYLQQVYGDVFEQPINKWVKQCQSKQWDGVTFAHLLDMNSGNYTSPIYSKDEASADKLAFFNASTNQDRLDFACQHYSRKSQPGTTFVYHTSDTYLLGVGLNAYIKSKLSADAELFRDVLYPQIFKPLGLSQITAVTRRTQDNDKQAYTGYGLFFTSDDMVKLARFLGQQTQVTTEQSVLAKPPLREALQLDPDKRGMLTDYNYLRYQHGFWARKIAPQPSFETLQWVPFMSGFGGITLALLGNSNSYYYFSDSHQYDWSGALPELKKLKLFNISSMPAFGSHITSEK